MAKKTKPALLNGRSPYIWNKPCIWNNSYRHTGYHGARRVKYKQYQRSGWNIHYPIFNAKYGKTYFNETRAETFEQAVLFLEYSIKTHNIDKARWDAARNEANETSKDSGSA